MFSGMIIVPLAIGTIAVVITLCYASYLDIQDRRVPFKTWGPMLAIGLPMTAAAFLLGTGDRAVIIGFLEIVSVVLFLAYLVNKDEKQGLSFTAFLACIAILTFHGYAGVYFLSKSELGIAILSIITSVILAYVTIREMNCWESRFSLWWPVLYFSIATLSWFFYAFMHFSLYAAYLALITLFILFYYFFIIGNLFGGADGWALICISLVIPLFPFEPLLGYPPLQFFPFTALVNAVIFNLLVPAGLFVMNTTRKNRAPWPYMFLGFPVEGSKIQDSYGFVIEEFEEKNGIMARRFLKLREALGSVIKGRNRVYTRDLRTHPDQYEKELTLYKKAGRVWISYGIPFIVPITAGVLFGLFIGDIVTLFLRFAGGI